MRKSRHTNRVRRIIRDAVDRMFGRRRSVVVQGFVPERMVFEGLESRRLLANEIVVENQLLGSPQSEWDVTGAGDLSIQGFATDMSVDQGGTVRFKVDSKNTADHRIDIYRMGYYGGLGARKVATIPAAQTIDRAQPAPLFDAVTGLI